MSPSTVPAAARPPPLPVASTARPAPPTHTRPLGLRQWRQQRPARRRLHFPLSLPSRPTSWPDRSPGRSPPSAPPEAGGFSREAIPGPRLPRPLLSRVPTLRRRARNWVSMLYGCRALANASQAAHPPARPVPGTYPAAPRASLAAQRSLSVCASPPLVSVSTEWRRRRCCEHRDPRAAESSLCKAG